MAGMLVSTDRDNEQQRWYFSLDNGTLGWWTAPKVRAGDASCGFFSLLMVSV
jgi:hypothetical protein